MRPLYTRTQTHSLTHSPTQVHKYTHTYTYIHKSIQRECVCVSVLCHTRTHIPIAIAFLCASLVRGEVCVYEGDGCVPDPQPVRD
jgi:hypothetical protein